MIFSIDSLPYTISAEDDNMMWKYGKNNSTLYFVIGFLIIVK